MRKLTAILGALACLYSPLRFGLIVLDDLGHERPAAKQLSDAGRFRQTAAPLRESAGQHKKIGSRRTAFRRPFYSKDKHFDLSIDSRKKSLPAVALTLESPAFSFFSKPLFLNLRSPPFLKSPL